MATGLTPSRGNILIPNVVVGRPENLYTPEATQRYHWGARYRAPDGRKFRYSHAGAVITSAHVDYALYFNIGARNKWYENPSQVQVAGDESITLPFDEANSSAGATIAVAKDELVGGTLVIYKNGVANQCVCHIVGNTVGAAATPYAVTIYLDRPLPYDVAVADGVELIASPYSDVRPGMASASALHTFCGYAPQIVTSGYNFWMQTSGIWRVSQAAAPGNYERSAYFDTSGGTSHRGDVGTGVTDQRAGTLITPSVDQAAFVMFDLDWLS